MIAIVGLDGATWDLAGPFMLLPSTIENAGAASASRSTVAPSADIHGRRITQPVHRVQNRDCVVSGRRDQ